MGDQYIALYDYQATADNGLNLRAGDIVRVNEKGTTGWWNGETATGSGWFPESYVQKLNLPPGWQALKDDQGRTYYYNSQTSQTSWTLPEGKGAGGGGGGGVSPSPSRGSQLDLAQAAAPAEDEPRTFAKDPNGRINYNDNFWSDTPTGSGFDVLVLKHRNGKDVIKEMAEWLRERSMLEERYAKDLMKLAKLPMGENEEGTMKTAWRQVKFDLENQSRVHQQLAQSILERVEKPLMEFKEGQKKARKDFEATIAKDRKVMTAKEQDVLKIKRSYEQAMKDAEQSELIVNRGATEQNKREFSKLEDKAKSDRKRATQAAIDYKKLVEDYSKVRQQWEDDMSLACLDFSEAEEERVAYVKKVLESYLDVEGQSRTKLGESAEMVRNSVQAVNAEVDIEMFVKAKSTGTRKPPFLGFEQYVSKK